MAQRASLGDVCAVAIANASFSTSAIRTLLEDPDQLKVVLAYAAMVSRGVDVVAWRACNRPNSNAFAYPKSARRAAVAIARSIGANAPVDAKTLAALGYGPRVARALLTDRPDVAAEVVRLATALAATPFANAAGNLCYQPDAPAWEPVVLYRGIRGDVLDPTYYANGGETYMATSAWRHKSQLYAQGDFGRGLLIEIQVPRFLLCSGNKGWPVLRQELADSLLPFIERLGVVNGEQAGGDARPNLMSPRLTELSHAWAARDERVTWLPESCWDKHLRNPDS